MSLFFRLPYFGPHFLKCNANFVSFKTILPEEYCVCLIKEDVVICAKTSHIYAPFVIGMTLVDASISLQKFLLYYFYHLINFLYQHYFCKIISNGNLHIYSSISVTLDLLEWQDQFPSWTLSVLFLCTIHLSKNGIEMIRLKYVC